MHVHESMYNGAFVYVNVHMCCVVNLCQLCVAVPLTSDHCVGANVGLLTAGQRVLEVSRSWDLLA